MKPFSCKRPNGCRDTLLLNRPLRISRFRLFQRVFVHFLRQIHLATCTKFPVQCTNKCGVRDIPRKMVRWFFSYISNYSTTIDGWALFTNGNIALLPLVSTFCPPNTSLYRTFPSSKPYFESEAECSEKCFLFT